MKSTKTLLKQPKSKTKVPLKTKEIKATELKEDQFVKRTDGEFMYIKTIEYEREHITVISDKSVRLRFRKNELVKIKV